MDIQLRGRNRSAVQRVQKGLHLHETERGDLPIGGSDLVEFWDLDLVRLEFDEVDSVFIEEAVVGLSALDISDCVKGGSVGDLEEIVGGGVVDAEGEAHISACDVIEL